MQAQSHPVVFSLPGDEAGGLQQPFQTHFHYAWNTVSLHHYTTGCCSHVKL